METFYRAQEIELEQTMEVRRGWEHATERTRRLAVAADAELRHRHPGRKLEPLPSAEPVVTEQEREQLALTPGPQAYKPPERSTQLAAERRIVQERLDERKALRIPSPDPDFEGQGDCG